MLSINNMFGLPPAETPERLAFMASFWPSLWSGVLSSIVTGLIVGLVLIYWQRSVEDRAARRSYAREVSVLREKIREAVAVPDVFIISSASASVPPKAAAAMNLLREAPISLWRDELDDEKPFLDLAYKFQRAYSKFTSSALELDKILSQFARNFNGARGAISANDGTITSYVLGKLQGFPSEVLAKWIGFGLKEIPAWVEEANTAATQDAAIMSAHAAYAKARNELNETLGALTKGLDA